MSKTMNRVFLMGHLGEKPDLKTSKAGKPYTRLNVATHRYRGTDQKEATEWHSVFVFGLEAERCARWLEKGAHVFVEGTLSYWKIETENPDKRYQNAINADRIRFLTYGSRAQEVDIPETTRNHNAVAHL